MTDQHSAELPQPRVSAFDDPSALVASQFLPTLVPSHLVVLPVGHDQFNATPLPSFPQRIVSVIRNLPIGLLRQAAFALRGTDFRERGVLKHNFCRRGSFQSKSRLNTFTVSLYHPLSAPAMLDFATCRAPFWLERNCRPGRLLPVQKAFSVDFSQKRSPGSEAFSCLFLQLQPPPCRVRARFAGPRVCLQSMVGSTPRTASIVSPAARPCQQRARSASTAHPSTASAASS
jgi:hypothetical protein